MNYDEEATSYEESSRATQEDLTPAERPPAERLGEAVNLGLVGVVLSGVPYVGAAYNELRSNRDKRIMERRLSTMNRELRKQMEGVREEAVNKAYLESEAFYDFIFKAVETVLRTRDREKIAFVASILKGAVLNPGQENHLAAEIAEEYLYLVSDLTPQELSVARTLYRLQKGQENMELARRAEA